MSLTAARATENCKPPKAQINSSVDRVRHTLKGSGRSFDSPNFIPALNPLVLLEHKFFALPVVL